MTEAPTPTDIPTPPAEAPLEERWATLTPEDRTESFRLLPWPAAEALFLGLDAHDQAEIIGRLPLSEQQLWLRLLAPDDAADVLQQSPADNHATLLMLLDRPVREEVKALLTYEEDHAGGLMTPRFAHVRSDMSSSEAIRVLRMQSKNQLETPYYVYVLDRTQRLQGVVSFWELFTAAPSATVQALMRTDMVVVTAEQDQEAVAALIAEHDLLAVPVVDDAGHMKGIITIDDIVDVVQEEATEDMQKLAGMEALDMPYLRAGLATMLKKRAGWLMVLFLGEMLTATAMGYYEAEIAQAVVLALFIPLIISSGGNTGSQASTLMIRAMALGEVQLGDWWRVIRRECLAGVVLGSMLGLTGMMRILLGQTLFHIYGEHAMFVALTVGLSLLGVALWGTLAGSMLPFLLRRFGFDPASSSAPLVATLVDVTGLTIYFSVAQFVLHGTLL